MQRREFIFTGFGGCFALAGCGGPPTSSQDTTGTPVLSVLRIAEVTVKDDSSSLISGLDRLVGDLSGTIPDREVFQTVKSAAERDLLGQGQGIAARLSIGLSLLSIARPGGLNVTRISGRFNLFSIEGNGIATVQGPIGFVLREPTFGTPREALGALANGMTMRLSDELQTRSFR